MITIKNTQRTIPIDQVYITEVAHIILEELGYKDFDLGIWFTTNATIRTYNRTYRHKDKATDILSFAFHTDLKAGQKIKVKDADDKNLGDLIISPLFVEELLPLYQCTLKERLAVLLVHGVCHLLGYTHYDPVNDQKMSALEKKLFKKLTLRGFATHH